MRYLPLIGAFAAVAFNLLLLRGFLRLIARENADDLPGPRRADEARKASTGEPIKPAR